MNPGHPIRDWLPAGKRAAVVFTIDDIHPGKSTDAYEAGGDLAAGALGHVEWLLERHPALWVTLFTTPDWREISPTPTRKLLARVPVLRDRLFLAPVHPVGTMRLDRHPEFVAYLTSLPRTEVALHGLHHVHPGPKLPVEFQDQDVDTCREMLTKAQGIFRDAGLDEPRGITPPAWNLTPGLATAAVDVGLDYVASARDIFTPVSAEATNAMSGLRGASLIYPSRLPGDLVHFSTNFQATSDLDRATAVVEAGGLLAVKAHIVKSACGHVQLDGMDELYRNYLDLLFGTLEDRYGDDIWWTSMAEVAAHLRAGAAERVPEPMSA